MRQRTYSPPNARPKMNALSMSSNECVELPSTRLSIRIQPSSYMNDAAPVRNAATVNHLVNLSVPGNGPDVACGAEAGSVCPRTIAQITKASEMLRSPAVRMVPGKPTALISTKPLMRTPIAAPRLLVKYRVASVSPGRDAGYPVFHPPPGGRGAGAHQTV